ncbi:enoyl-CoA hydratase-related protein [Novosphingobium sp. BL-52-GroH]|uniref:enoyl-CoA hydratase-related protein n=1 Tax=Novosphingobium sp. BL-52-GroH TaxID=3349877 RepID=UPI00384B6F48
MDNFTFEIGSDGVAVVTFDVPGKSMNTISHAVQRELGELADLLGTDDRIVGAVLRSGKLGGFCAGADLRELAADMDVWRAATSQEELRAGVAEAGDFSRQIRALETCGKPLVAVVHGVVLGGGLELALGCHWRIAIDTPSLRLGLPEATLDLMPGAGATQRLIRLAGLVPAVPFLVDGAPIALSDALALGIIDVAAQEGEAIDRAREWILANRSAQAPWDAKGFRMPDGGPHTATGYGMFGPAIAARRGAGGEAEAAANIFKAMYEGSQVPIDAALRIESRYFFNTARSPAAARQVQAFFAARKAAV